MKLTVVTDSWPTVGTDSIYLNSVFRKEATNIDICVLTTSKDGFSTVEGIHGFIVHRVQSVPYRTSGLFLDEVTKVLAYDTPDILYVLNPVRDFHFTGSKVNIAHWTSAISSAHIDEEVVKRYQIHTTYENKHKLRLVALGVEESSILVMTPITAHAIIISAITKTLNDHNKQEIAVQQDAISLKPLDCSFINFTDKNITVTATPYYVDVSTDVLKDIKDWRDAILVTGESINEIGIDIPEEHRSMFFNLNENLKLRNAIYNQSRKTANIRLYPARISYHVNEDQ